MRISRTLAGMKILLLVTAMAAFGLAGTWAGDEAKDKDAEKKAEKAAIGEVAPDFALSDSLGEKHKLSDYRGKVVVLEWFNNECPFVRKFYSVGEMQRLQAEIGEKGVVWFTICSSAPGTQGYYAADDMAAVQERNNAKSKATLLDPTGKVGRIFNARTTPQMVVIDADGVLRYNGAIDSISTANPADIEKAEPYFVNAVNQVLAGEEVAMPTTTPYGCSVKYE